MKKLFILLSLAALSTSSLLVGVDKAFAAENAAVTSPAVGKMLFSTGGKKLATVYKIAVSGAPQVLLDGKLVTVPASSLTEVDGKVVTSLSKRDLLSNR